MSLSNVPKVQQPPAETAAGGHAVGATANWAAASAMPKLRLFTRRGSQLVGKSTMALDYVALVLLIVIIGLVVYGLIGIWGIPYEIAKKRNHPHQDAIGAATWVSLFTLGALWPFLWIWAMAYRPDRGWGLSSKSDTTAAVTQLEKRVTVLEHALERK